MTAQLDAPTRCGTTGADTTSPISVDQTLKGFGKLLTPEFGDDPEMLREVPTQPLERHPIIPIRTRHPSSELLDSELYVRPVKRPSNLP